MSGAYWGDPGDAYYRWDADQAEAERKLKRISPLCQLCGEPILDDHCYCLTTSDTTSEKMLACIHYSCLRVYQIGSNDKMDEILRGLIEEVAYCDTPRIQD